MNTSSTALVLRDAVEVDTAPDPDVERTIGEAGPKGRRATRRVIRTILQDDPRWRGRLRRDLFRDQVVLDGQPLTDADLTRASCWIEEVYQATPSRDLLHEVAGCVAEDQAFHPVREYLARLAWDGVERATRVLPDLLGVEDAPLHREIGRAFLVGAVARVEQPGCKVDTMLVLVGEQGAGKSRFCAGLMPDPAWFGDTPVDLRSKDAYVALQGKWLYELAEMEAVRGRSATRVKSFLSSPVDHYRAPYARVAEDHPRQCVFVGTSNHPDLFDDGTGSRRFWPVQVGRVDLDALARDRDQLWAEALVRYRRGETWHLDPALDRVRQAESVRYQMTDPHRERLEAWLETVTGPFTTADALAKGLGIGHVAARGCRGSGDRGAARRVEAMALRFEQVPATVTAPATDSALAVRIQGVEARVEALAARFAEGQAKAAREVAAATRELGHDRDSTNERVADLIDRVDALEAAAGAKPDRQAPDSRRVEARLAEIDEALRRLKRKLAGQDARITALDEGAAAVVNLLAGADGE